MSGRHAETTKGQEAYAKAVRRAGRHIYAGYESGGGASPVALTVDLQAWPSRTNPRVRLHDGRGWRDADKSGQTQGGSTEEVAELGPRELSAGGVATTVPVCIGGTRRLTIAECLSIRSSNSLV